MSDQPTLLFLHGVGQGDRDDNWKLALGASMTALGYPSLDSARVIAPKYAHALKGSDESETLPPVTIKQPTGDAARLNRREFERRMGAIEFRLGFHERGKGWAGGGALVNAVVGLQPFEQAHNYLTKPEIRAQVLNRILSKLPDSGSLIIVGHSLGSVIAADLLRHLPMSIEVAGLVTIGSPLANGRFDVDQLRKTLKEPPVNLGWWVNFWNGRDPVAAHRGVSSVFPWMVDFRIETRALDPHAALEYLSDERVAAAVGFALFGSRSTELVRAERGFDIPLDDEETVALLALRYAHLIMNSLEGDSRDRFAGALRQVQATAFADLWKRNRAEGRQMPAAIMGLAFDLADPLVVVPQPVPVTTLTGDAAAVMLIVLATDNVIRPFEIATKNKPQLALKNLTREIGIGSQFGSDVFEAVKIAQETLSGGAVAKWLKFGAMAAGAAALVAATGGLALAAGPGLVGAAAITSSLAAFGPGGMLGGLVTAGTLLTAGTSGIALGLAKSSAETLEAIVVRLLAVEILRDKQNLQSDPGVWRSLVEIEIEVRRQHEKLDEFSDGTSAVLKDLKQKTETVERALKYLRDHGLEPGSRRARR